MRNYQQQEQIQNLDQAINEIFQLTLWNSIKILNWIHKPELHTIFQTNNNFESTNEFRLNQLRQSSKNSVLILKESKLNVAMNEFSENEARLILEVPNLCVTMNWCSRRQISSKRLLADEEHSCNFVEFRHSIFDSSLTQTFTNGAQIWITNSQQQLEQSSKLIWNKTH